jgi:hypothetical protein
MFTVCLGTRLFKLGFNYDAMTLWTMRTLLSYVLSTHGNFREWKELAIGFVLYICHPWEF